MKKRKINWVNIIKALVLIACICQICYMVYIVSIHGFGLSWFGLYILFMCFGWSGVILSDFSKELYHMK